MRKFHKLAATLCAAFLFLIPFSTVAHAGGGEETEEATEIITQNAAEETEAEANPFTPAGTGTVIDAATDEDGKEFYTIMTPDENVFYLIIDMQRETENVYFLNAVTERDLLAFAEKSEDTEENTVSAIPDTETAAKTTPEPEDETPTEPEPESGGNGGIIVVVLIVLAAGGAGYYFKIYRPKHQQSDSEDEYEYEANEDGDDYSDYEDTEPEDDTLPWDEEYSGDGDA